MKKGIKTSVICFSLFFLFTCTSKKGRTTEEKFLELMAEMPSYASVDIKVSVSAENLESSVEVVNVSGILRKGDCEISGEVIDLDKTDLSAETLTSENFPDKDIKYIGFFRTPDSFLNYDTYIRDDTEENDRYRISNDFWRKTKKPISVYKDNAAANIIWPWNGEINFELLGFKHLDIGVIFQGLIEDYFNSGFNYDADDMYYEYSEEGKNGFRVKLSSSAKKVEEVSIKFVDIPQVEYKGGVLVKPEITVTYTYTGYKKKKFEIITDALKNELYNNLR